MKIDFGGLYPPIPIPFAEDEKIRFDMLEANIRKWNAQPLDGIVVPGSNSEAVHISREERTQIWKTCAPLMKASGRRMIAGVGADATAEVISMIQDAAALGADAVLMLPPYFYKPAMTHTVLVEHFRAAADQSPIPIIIYNVPAYTGVDFTPQTLLELANHERIIGVKDSSANVVKIASVLAQRPDFQVFAGTGSALLPFLSLGAVGGVMALANFAALPLRKLVDAFENGDMETARRIQLSLAEINSAVTSRFGVPGLKYALDRTGFYGGPPRRPLQPANAEIRTAIDALLAKLELD